MAATEGQSPGRSARTPAAAPVFSLRADLLDAMGPRPSRRSAVAGPLDRYVREAAVLGPGPVVAGDVGPTEQLVQHEPDQPAAVADPAVDGDVVAGPGPGREAHRPQPV